MIAYCGLRCDTCPIHLATIEQDPEKRLRLRRKVADSLRSHYHIILSPDEVPGCSGCKHETGPLFLMCAKCSVRNCARERHYESCAYCLQYPCENLQEVFKLDPQAKIELERLRG